MRQIELFDQCADRLCIDFGGITWKPAPLTEKDQEHGETKPVGLVLGHHQLAFSGRQNPVRL